MKDIFNAMAKHPIRTMILISAVSAGVFKISTGITDIISAVNNKNIQK